MRKDQNFKKNPHTARFLMKFHDANGANYAEDATADHAETEAVAFVTARAPRPVAGREVEIKGWKVRVDDGFISEAQAKWMIDIATTRVLPAGATVESLKVRMEQGFAKYAGSQFITKYRGLPKAAPAPVKKAAEAPAAPSTEVPAGRYAVTDPTDGVLKFYRLDLPTEGRWAGYVFLKVQASGDLYPVRARAHKDAVIAEIAKDIEGAARRYGQELGKCYACGRVLTDATSRSLGIGPDCRNK